MEAELIHADGRTNVEANRRLSCECERA